MERFQCRRPTEYSSAHKFLQGLSLFEERYTMVGFERAGAYRVVDFVDQWLLITFVASIRTQAVRAGLIDLHRLADFCRALH